MKKLLFAIVLCATCFSSVAAQVGRPNGAGVAMGHVHLNVRDVEGHKNFWVGLGATPVRIGTAEAVKMDGLLIVLREQTPMAPMSETVINHFGVLVPQFEELRAHLDSSGIKMDPAREGSGDWRQSSAYGPNDFRVELTENPALTTSLASHHLHYNVADPTAVQQWYADMLEVTPGKRSRWVAGDLPGMNLTYAEIPEGASPTQTKGRLMDHIGFEVSDLEAFVATLAERGVKLDTPIREDPELGVKSAFLTDPWGTSIELTEGLRGL